MRLDSETEWRHCARDLVATQHAVGCPARNKDLALRPWLYAGRRA